MSRQVHARIARSMSRSRLSISAALCGAVLAFHGSAVLAAVIDLTTAGSSGMINGAIYEQAGPQSTGTGTIDTFSQQNAGGSATSSQAYNTTVNNVLDGKSTDQDNHAITLGEVPLVFRSGTPYREFLLDTNEN